jgi:hypothetical protein
MAGREAVEDAAAPQAPPEAMRRDLSVMRDISRFPALGRPRSCCDTLPDMRSRHVASLSLLVWYLLMPPENDVGQLLLNAPLKDWTRIHGFDSATECEDAKAFWMTENGYRSMLAGSAKRGLTDPPPSLDAYQSIVRNDRCRLLP